MQEDILMSDFDFGAYFFILVLSPFTALYAYRVLTPKCSFRRFLLYSILVASVVTALEIGLRVNAALSFSVLGLATVALESVSYLLLWRLLSTDSFWKVLLFYFLFVVLAALGNAAGSAVNSLLYAVVAPDGSLFWRYSDVIFTDLFQILLFLVISEFVSLKVKRVDVDVRWSMFAILLLAQVFSQMVMAIFLTWNRYALSSALLNGISALLCVIADVYILRTFRSMVRNAELERRVALLNQQQALDRQQYLAAGEQIANVRRLWHDYDNTLTAIGALLDMGRTDDIRALVSQTSTELAKARIVRTGSPIVDAVLYSKQLTAAEQGIRLTCSLLWSERIPVEEIDLMRVFSNLLDNAIRYCEALPEGAERRIDVTSALRGRICVVSFINSYLESAPPALPAAGSDAADAEHGHGLAIVRSIAEKYGGTLTIDAADGKLTLRVLFSLPA